MQETPVRFLGWEDLWEKGQATHSNIDFSGGSDNKASAYNVGDLGSVPGLGKSPGGRYGNALQYYCLVGYSPWDHKELDTLSG